MNSSIEIAEAAKLADKLIDRTREGRIRWELVGEVVGDFPPPERVSYASFATPLESNLRAFLSTNAAEAFDFKLVEVDPRNSGGGLNLLSNEPWAPDKIVLSVSVEKDPPYGYGTQQEKHLAGLLVDLYGLARRSALKMDASVERALSYLDRIAG